MRLRNSESRKVKSEEKEGNETGIGLKNDYYGGGGELGFSTAIVGEESTGISDRIRDFTINSEIDHDQDEYDEGDSVNNDEDFEKK